MIIWINGAFGAGKTQTAAELHRRIPDSFVYDPENAGFWLRKNEPEMLRADNFQDEALWRSVNRDMLSSIAARYDGTVLVPMTIIEPAYYREILLPLREQGVDVRHFLLYPSKEVLEKRLRSRGEGKNAWVWRQTERCCRAFEDPVFENRIDNGTMSIPETAETIAAACGLPLLPRTGKIENLLNRLRTTIRAVRHE